MLVIFARALTRPFSERRAVDIIDIDIYPGGCFGIAWPNGAAMT